MYSVSVRSLKRFEKGTLQTIVAFKASPVHEDCEKVSKTETVCPEQLGERICYITP